MLKWSRIKCDGMVFIFLEKQETREPGLLGNNPGQCAFYFRRVATTLDLKPQDRAEKALVFEGAPLLRSETFLNEFWEGLKLISLTPKLLHSH